MKDQYLSLSQVAKLAKITAATLSYHVKKYGLPASEVVAGRKLFKERDVMAWIKTREQI